MTFLLPLLCLPLFVAVVAPPDQARGSRTARCIVVVFALATLAQATGTLDPAVLRVWAGADASNALFVSVSIGLVVGGVAPWPPQGWRGWIAGVPLAVFLLANHAAHLRWGPLLLGSVLGALPLLLARALPRVSLPVPQVTDARAAHSSRSAWQVMMVAAMVTLIEPLLLTLVTPLLPLVWRRGGESGWQPASRQLWWPLVAACVAVAVGWLAFTVAGTPLVMLGNFVEVAPVSMAAERLLALLATLLLVAMIAPWPLHRFGVGLVLAPAAVVLGFRFSSTLVPGGMPEWRALAAMLLVVPAIGGTLRGHWAHGLSVVALLLAMQGDAWSAVPALVALAASLAVVARAPSPDPAVTRRVSFPVERGTALAAAVGLAMTPAVLLSDEVVLATLLAFGTALAAARPTPSSPAA